MQIELSQASPGDAPWQGPLRERLRGCPDPAHAANLASRLLSSLSESDRERLFAEPAERWLEILGTCCGTAPFLCGHLIRRPELLLSLAADDLSQPRERETLAAECEQALASELPAEVALRRLKYAELARLTIRDCSPWVPLADSGTTLAEISQLADTLIEGALSVARSRLEERAGSPRWTDATGEERELGFAVLGLGKLGSEELNFSSDVDLVYVMEAPGDALRVTGDALAPSDYFQRLAQELGRLLGDASEEGFLYRVDLDLRPEGTRGGLVISDDALANYFEVSADPWEKAAFMKARPVAGDLALGWRSLRHLSPMIYRSSLDFAAVDAIRDLKRKVEAAHTSGNEDSFNVKLDSGGIRDLEFIAQSMQLLHGGRIPQIRSRSTQNALSSLGDVGLLPEETVAGLLEAYRFLRRIENRIQMHAERQTHELSSDPAARTLVARGIDYRGPEELADFDDALAETRSRVLATFREILFEDGTERILEIFLMAAPRLVAFPGARPMVQHLAENFAREIDASADPERALNNLDRFIRAVGERRFYYELLMDRPELVPRLVACFGASHFLSNYLARYPRLIEPVFENPDELLLGREELARSLEEILLEVSGQAAPDAEAQLSALRLFHHREIVNVGLLDIASQIGRPETERALTDLAGLCVEGALRFAEEALATRRARLLEQTAEARFAVIGMGKLGSNEMSYGSDLDLIFLYDLDDPGPGAVASAQDFFVRLAQRLISAIQTPTPEGFCYEIDARMRPSGNQGTLVTSLSAFRRYHEESGQLWERQALLRARPVAGDPRLASDFLALRLEILGRPLSEEDVAEIHRVRKRMEHELAQETGSLHNFKTGRGGVLDVESVVQLLRLRHGGQHPELLEPGSVDTALEHFEEFALLDPESLRSLREGWDFLRRLGSRMRIVENRSISDLNEERGDLDGLARRMGYDEGARSSSARRALLQDYRRHTSAIRRVYEQVFV